jgi:hypothetical protein
MMGSIYNKARRVLSWLGDDGGNAKAAFDLIYRIPTRWSYTNSDYNNRLRAPSLLEASDPIFGERLGASWEALR